ncbi:MAG: DUF2203 domain-containing protein [Armatimonadetes bacterium]|nr:DUF2203 domain-containing protein [Armatimonadota bacterium]
MPGYAHKRHFTIEEANSLIPRLTPLLLRIQDAWDLFQKQRERSHKSLRQAGSNGEPHTSDEDDALHLLEQLTADVETHGCVVKGHAQGLIDFPSIREGREVYLCWCLGEPEVQAWHELDAGFAARQPLEPAG